ncbi:rRNA pseudouridine synthase [Helcococcus ovis]|uniref:pseudouridine synthase n=1 Tax=Helcococcus ovis TaxID=72026 RepID=UPI00106FED13|nr:pseudouridine synthase [Helcococcus ovis]TFF67614.1 rRNA pseudouridine synthase [Helcococcus ovis]WNZ00966.1 pseudouridine synthase [Helcococcus ovis]
MRIDKYLSNSGIGTRKEVKQYIKNGLILLNDKVVLKSTQQVDENKDKIKFKNHEIIYKKYIYLMMNKPQGYISATKDYNDTVLDLLDEKFQNKDIFPVGRLDKDTEGLLILTNDGKLAHELLSPKKKVDKKYYAKVDNILSEEDIDKFKDGIYLEKEQYLTMPAKLEIISNYECYVYIKEGKYHQVKRMLKSCGKEVLYLKRISMGNVNLDETLDSGQYRELTEKEIEILKKN